MGQMVAVFVGNIKITTTVALFSKHCILPISLLNYSMAKGKKRSTGVKNPHLKRNERKQHVEKKYN